MNFTQIIKQELDLRVAQKNSFSAYDITRDLRSKGYIISHPTIRDEVHSYMKSFKGYTSSNKSMGAVTFTYYEPINNASIVQKAPMVKSNSPLIKPTSSTAVWVPLNNTTTNSSSSKKVGQCVTDSMGRLVLSKTFLKNNNISVGTKVRSTISPTGVTLELNPSNKPTHTVNTSRGYLRVYVGLRRKKYSISIHNNTIKVTWL